MKKVLLFAVLLLAFCSGVEAKNTWKKGQAEWAKIQLNENLAYDQSFGIVLELVSDKYEIEMISKDGGYIRSAWNFLVDKKGKKLKDLRCRITIKYNHDKSQIQVKTETQKLKKDDWIDGVDEALASQIKEDLRGVVGY
jgi:hypothetical protein